MKYIYIIYWNIYIIYIYLITSKAVKHNTASATTYLAFFWPLIYWHPMWHRQVEAYFYPPQKHMVFYSRRFLALNHVAHHHTILTSEKERNRCIKIFIRYFMTIQRQKFKSYCAREKKWMEFTQYVSTHPKGLKYFSDNNHLHKNYHLNGNGYRKWIILLQLIWKAFHVSDISFWKATSPTFESGFCQRTTRNLHWIAILVQIVTLLSDFYLFR